MTDTTRVMVTGAAGQLGSTVVARLSATCDVFPFTRAELDLADAPAVLAATTNCSPDFVVNCAAYNDVEAAEDAAAAALSGNALAVQALARAAGATGATLIHYGTDFVFDGTADRPYVETDACRPLSTYGMSKLLGEWFALEAPGAYVLRVESLFGGRPAKSSIDKIIAAIRAGQPVRVFADRTVTPSFVDDVASATEPDHPPDGRPPRARRVSLRQQRRHDLARHRRGDRAAASARCRADSGQVDRRQAQGQAPGLLRALEREAESRRHRDANMARGVEEILQSLVFSRQSQSVSHESSVRVPSRSPQSESSVSFRPRGASRVQAASDGVSN